MVTENGLTGPALARRHIEALRTRRDYIAGRLDEIAAEKPEGWNRDATYAAGEIRALDWALPVLEAEWDYQARLRHALNNQKKGTPDEIPNP